MGNGCIHPHFLNHGTSWRWVISFTPRPHYLRGRIGCWVDPRAGLDDVEKREFLPLPGLELRTPPTPRSSSLKPVAIPPTLFQKKKMLPAVFVTRNRILYKWESNFLVGYKGFWWWCITHRISRFFYYMHSLEFYTLENTFRKLDLLPFSEEGERTSTQLSPLVSANLNHWTTTVRFTTAI
jgi:hypothetical protein